MMSVHDEESGIFHEVTDFEYGVTSDCSLSVMCRGKRFYITIAKEDLEDHEELSGSTRSSTIAQEYLRLLDGLDTDEDGTGIDKLYDWALEPCLPVFRELTLTGTPRDADPGLIISGPTLQEYFSPVTFIFRLVNQKGKLVAQRCADDPAMTAHLAPRVPSAELSKYPDLLRVSASDVHIVPDPDEPESAGSENPKKVACLGKEYFFKAAFESHSFERELDILYRLRRFGLNTELRVSSLQGVVTSDDNDSIIGVLLGLISPGSKTLHSVVAFDEPSVSMRERWTAQVKHIVGRLHEAGIAWGDVKPDNVLVDDDGNAWVIDFGGGHSRQWVDNAKAETVEGDLQGVSRMEMFLMSI